MADVDGAFKFSGGIVVQRVLCDPDDAPIARLPDFLCQRRLSAARLADQKARPVPGEIGLDPRAIGNARPQRNPIRCVNTSVIQPPISIPVIPTRIGIPAIQPRSRIGT